MSKLFFKSFLPYRLTKTVEAFHDVDALNAALAVRPRRDPTSQEIHTAGFALAYVPREQTLADREDPALVDELEPEAPLFVRSVNNGEFLLVAVTEVERRIDSGGIKLAVQRRVAQIEQSQLRKVYKKERDQLKDEVIQASLPTALLREKTTYALIVPGADLIFVNAASPRKAELVLSLLREVLGSLPVRPVSAKLRPAASFTEWVKTSKCPSGLHLLDAVMMESTAAEGTKLAAVRADLESDEVINHLATGLEVTRLALGFEDKMGFMLDNNLRFSKVFFSDLLHDQADADAGAGDSDFNALFDATVLIMGRTLMEMFPLLMTAVGGEERPTWV